MTPPPIPMPGVGISGAGMIDLGFSGSREGLTQDQLDVLRERLTPPNTTWAMLRSFHHGDCVGGDEQAHEMMLGMRARYGRLDMPSLVIHPPMQVKYRAFCQGDRVMKPKSYLERDREIAQAIDLLIAAPKAGVEEVRSGTWYTIRRCRELGKKVIIILPDGNIRRENFNETTRSEAWHGTNH